ncbi:MAG: hypothetical protein EOP48_05640 [Sphingobacteriales bacterium]|nr:MAG: hypothetical protein EOP48_05640 [Sphingobacteriales bacterium]
MTLKDLPVVLFQLELTKAKLKIAELSAKSAEMQIYETVCQNLVLVHFKLASISTLEKPGINIEELSALVLKSVRDLKKLSKQYYSTLKVESETEFLDLLQGTNHILNLGLSEIRIEGEFERLTNADFLYTFLTLHNLLVVISGQKRKLNSVHVYGSNSGVRCVINYSGLPIHIGRLTSKNSSSHSKYPNTNFTLLKSFAGKLVSSHSIARKKNVQLEIPLLRESQCRPC